MRYNGGVNYFYRDPMTDRERGPVSLVEMARKALPGDTRVRAEDAREWMTLARAAASQRRDRAPSDTQPAADVGRYWLLVIGLAGVALFGVVAGGEDIRPWAAVMLLGVLCGAATLAMGSASRMDYGVAFILGFLLGPLGVLAALIIWAVRSTRQTA